MKKHIEGKNSHENRIMKTNLKYYIDKIICVLSALIPKKQLHVRRSCLNVTKEKK